MLAPVSIRGGYKTFTIAIASFVMVVSAIWFIAAQARADTSPCRLLADPSEVLPLSEAALKDLHADESRLDPGVLKTPSEQQAEAVPGWQHYPARTTWVCGIRGSSDVAVVSHSREEDNRYRCYGVSCPGGRLPTVWVTCYSVLDPPEPRVLARACVGFPKD